MSYGARGGHSYGGTTKRRSFGSKRGHGKREGFPEHLVDSTKATNARFDALWKYGEASEAKRKELREEMQTASDKALELSKRSDLSRIEQDGAYMAHMQYQQAVNSMVSFDIETQLINQRAQAEAKAQKALEAGKPVVSNRLIDSVKHGDKVTIVKPDGKKVTGNAVMRSSTGGWVLNTGGEYGTTDLADDSNVVKVN